VGTSGNNHHINNADRRADMLEIYADTADGRTIKCFTWCLDLESGIARAKADAAKFGIEAIRFWAREI
jgi:hypothetical protein